MVSSLFTNLQIQQDRKLFQYRLIIRKSVDMVTDKFDIILSKNTAKNYKNSSTNHQRAPTKQH